VLLSLSTRASSQSLCQKDAADGDHRYILPLTLTGGGNFFEPLQELVQRLNISINSSSLLITQRNLLKKLEETIPRLKPEPTI
jgi:hypothetical protein